MKQGVFIDRDGTINEEIGYLHEPERLALIPGAAKAIKRLNDAGWIVVCITNQAGVARGYYPIEAVTCVHERLGELLALENAHLDKIYFCPHHPSEGFFPYKQDCHCRKPSPGMLKEAAQEFNLDLSRSYMIGDSLTDVQVAQNTGVRAILVMTGYGKKTLENLESQHQQMPDYICSNLREAVEWIIRNTENSGDIEQNEGRS